MEIILSAWLTAVALQEGRGVIKHDAYNRIEDARGAWQVRPVMIDEVYRLTGKRWEHSRMHEPTYARAFAASYFRARLARGETHWKITRRWNGSGPDARRYACEVERRYRELVREQVAAANRKAKVRG